MGWLFKYTLLSAALAFIVERIVEFFLGGVQGGFVAVAKPFAFVSSWSAMTAHSGMQSVTKRAQFWRRRTAAARDRIVNKK